MCGINGILSIKDRNTKDYIVRMNDAILYRGPNNQSTFEITTSAYSLQLGHVRLSILDLNERSNQPMKYKHYCLTFNGEIYNYREIRKELSSKGHCFNTDSDTEVILHAYEEWKYDCVSHFIGMFAFTLVDECDNSMFICRDRAGVKPLYYSCIDDYFIFSSELKAFRQLPFYNSNISLYAAGLYFKLNYIPAPYSIYENTYKLLPGSYLVVDLAECKVVKEINYWNPISFYQKPTLDISYEEAQRQLELLLISACDYRMISDVPVGVFLSGGYDSAGVASIIQARQSDKIKTFTIGFSYGINEAPAAKRIAEYLGTDHTEYICTPRDAQQVVRDLPYYYDEPMADNSSIPTILVSRLAQKKVKVVLSADAGDELFAGYTSYRNLYKNKNLLSLISGLPKNTHIASIIEDYMDLNSGLGRKAYKFANLFSENGSYRSSLFHERLEPRFSKLFNLPFCNLFNKLSDSCFNNSISLVQCYDYLMYLPNDILTKVDRATMSVSIEGRGPLLDHRLLEFSATLPTVFKIDKYSNKRLFKDIVHRYIPEHFLNRPKAGFAMPINEWLRTDLKYLLNDYLSQRSLNEVGIYNVKSVIALRDDFLKGNFSEADPIIWKILHFQMWFEKWIKNKYE